MPLLAPTLVFLLAATPAEEDVPALLRARSQQLLDAITRGERLPMPFARPSCGW